MWIRTFRYSRQRDYTVTTASVGSGLKVWLCAPKILDNGVLPTANGNQVLGSWVYTPQIDGCLSELWASIFDREIRDGKECSGGG